MGTRFVYVIYIRTTPEKLFEALTDPDTNRRFWIGYAQISDWKKGAAWSVQDAGGTAWDEGEVLEFDPPRKIVVSWRHIRDEAVRAEGFSRASFEIEPMGEVVKLTLTHEIDVENSKLIEGVSGGWPMILSNLKTLLESQDQAATPA